MLVSSNSLICCSMSYGSICRNLWVVKFLILILVFYPILIFHLKKINNNVSTIRLYLKSTLYFIITWKYILLIIYYYLKYIRSTSRIIILCGNIEINLVSIILFQVRVLRFVTGIQTTYLSICTRKFPCY